MQRTTPPATRNRSPAMPISSQVMADEHAERISAAPSELGGTAFHFTLVYAEGGRNG